MDSQSRSFAKAISYRLMGSCFTAVLFFVFSGKPALSLGAGLLDMVAKLGLYFLHERLWDRISFGRTKPPEYEI